MLFDARLDARGLADIQGIVLRLYRLPYAKYLFLHFADATHAQQWVGCIAERITSVTDWDTFGGSTQYTWNVAFTSPGLAALDLPPDVLTTFPLEFREGIATPERAQLLGDTGPNGPIHWDAPLGTDAVHAMLFLYAADSATRQAQEDWHIGILQQFPGVTVVYEQDAALLPTGREHFGYRDGIGSPAVEGSGLTPLPGQGPPVKTGEFILGYPDEVASHPPMPKPDALGRNGSFVVFRKLEQHVGAFRAFLQSTGADLEVDPELLAAKMVGRWRSGAPLALAPDKDDPDLGGDPMRNNNFSYAQQDPEGLHIPPSSHIRRGYGRDMQPEKIASVQRHRILRGGVPYGPPLPEGAPDDGAERGLIFLFFGASIERQFEFVQSMWLNDGDFLNLGTDKDPLIGANDEPTHLLIPRHPVHLRVKGIPRFVTVRGGGYFFMPSLTALRYLAQPDHDAT